MTCPDRVYVAGACLALGAVLLGCSQAASVFLDLPPPEEELSPSTAVVSGGGLNAYYPEDLSPPAIESVDDRDSVLAMLPRDHAGVVDWEAAVRQGVIRPRAAPPGESEEYPGVSGHDFYFPGPPETYFPHSTHTYWLTCRSCHPGIYRYRGEADMASCKEGCHDTVAFTLAACERCHADLDMKPGRLGASLGEPLVLRHDDRPTVAEETEGVPEAAEAADSVDAGAAQFDGRGGLYAQVRFEHWVHRINYRCTACHTDRFAIELGQTPWAGTEAHEERLCGGCHNGVAAFDIGVNECHLCHYQEGDAEGGEP